MVYLYVFGALETPTVSLSALVQTVTSHAPVSHSWKGFY